MALQFAAHDHQHTINRQPDLRTQHVQSTTRATHMHALVMSFVHDGVAWHCGHITTTVVTTTTTTTSTKHSTCRSVPCAPPTTNPTTNNNFHNKQQLSQQFLAFAKGTTVCKQHTMHACQPVHTSALHPGLLWKQFVPCLVHEGGRFELTHPNHTKLV